MNSIRNNHPNVVGNINNNILRINVRQNREENNGERMNDDNIRNEDEEMN